MGQLKTSMTHSEVAGHLREEVCNTATFETGRLVGAHPTAPMWHASPAYLGATRAVLSDLDYVAALWNGTTPTETRRQLASRKKTVKFMGEVLATGSGMPGYCRFANQLYDLYRNGTIHLRTPKVIRIR